MEEVLVIPGERFTTVTPDDHGGIIWVVSLICLVYTLLTYAMRLFIKHNMVGVDDYIMTAAQVLAFGYYTSTFISLTDGLGKNLDIITRSEKHSMSRAAYGMSIMFILTICLAKISVMFLFRRVFTRDMKNFWVICNVIAGLIAVWGLGSAIALTVGCDSHTYMPPMASNSCTGQVLRWKIVMAIDIATELIFVLLPMYMVKDLQMPTNLKVRVVIAFAFRLPVAACGIAFLRHLELAYTSGNPGVAISTAIVWQQIELGYSLMAATIPCIKSFIKSFDTGYGMEVMYASNPYGSNDSKNGTNIPLESLKHGAQAASNPVYSSNADSGHATRNASAENQHKQGQQQRGGASAPPTARGSRRGSRAASGNEDPQALLGKLRPENLQNQTVIYHPKTPSRDNGSVDSDGSQEMIIRRDVRWDVRTDYVHDAS